jgi:vancomycin aglycone glucosyltransferase
MRVLIGAFGTRGDVQPMLALSLALTARGHRVTLVVPPEAAALTEGHPIRVHTCGLSYLEVSQRMASGRLLDVLSVLPTMRRQVDAHFEALEPLAGSADVIVGSAAFIVGPSLSALTGRPYAYFALSPLMLDGDDNPGPLLPFYRLPRALNRLSWWLTHQVWNLSSRGRLNRLRRTRGLPTIRQVWREVLGKHPFLAAEPLFAPRSHPFAVNQPGGFFLDTTEPLSEATEAFLEAGSPPVYLGFGSMADPNPRRTTERLLKSIRRAGLRAIVSSGWAKLGGVEAPEGVRFAGPEPHHRLFSRCIGVVHHGGAGTTHAAARAGVPQVVMPQILDQFHWRHRLIELGLSPGRVDRYERDPEPLARALRALTDPRLQARARGFAARMRVDGSNDAVTALETLR